MKDLKFIRVCGQMGCFSFPDSDEDDEEGTGFLGLGIFPDSEDDEEEVIDADEP